MVFTAKYTATSSGYMGQIMEWPEVVTEGFSIENCREMLKDALKQMILAHKQLGLDLPINQIELEKMTLEMDYVC